MYTSFYFLGYFLESFVLLAGITSLPLSTPIQHAEKKSQPSPWDRLACP